MKKFFHDYSYSSIKMFVNQIAIAIFGTSLTFATTHAHGASQSFDTFTLVVSIFAVLFYLFLLYTMTWEIGAKDRISVDTGRKPYRPHLGLLLSIIANVPNFILAILYLIADLTKTEGMLFIVRLISSLLQGMYFGIITTVSVFTSNGWVQLNCQWYTFFLMTVPALLTCWLAYFMGFKNIRIIAKPPQAPSEKPKMKK